MKVLYTLFDAKNHSDISIVFEHENAKIMRDHLNAEYADFKGTENEVDYAIGVETFRDEEWPAVLRLLRTLHITQEQEQNDMQFYQAEKRGLEDMPVKEKPHDE